MEKYEVIIIGAGASGIMCALQTTKKTLLLEASDRVGKKILATGNGKCNITNDNLDVEFYNTPLVEPYFQQFNQQQTIDYFADLGIMTYADEAGRRYPLSNSANTVLDLLLKALSQKTNVTTMVNTIPLIVTKNADGFMVKTKNQTYVCNQLVLATGGNSGTQYLQQLKVNYHAFRPSLVGLKTTKNKGLAGVRVSDVCVKMNGFTESGEILFKEDGISGIVIFNLSAHLARSQINSCQISIDLLSKISANNLFAMLQNSIKHNPYYLLTDILTGFLHKSLAKNIIEKLAWTQKVAQNVTTQEIGILVNIIKNYVVNVTGFADNNQVHTGGVDLKDLDAHLQHRQIKNLYFVGELVDVDGDCGGYNLQWAWTSGKIVGDSTSL